MDRGGRPSDKTVATINMDRQTEETTNPEKKKQRMEDQKYMKNVRACLCVCPCSPRINSGETIDLYRRDP
jgi:hypothetical protein